MADAPGAGDLEGRLELAYAQADADAIRRIADEADSLAATEPAMRAIAQTARFYLDRLDSPPPAGQAPAAPAARAPLSRGTRAWIAVCSALLGVGAAVSLVAGIVLAVAAHDRFGAAATLAYVLYGVIVAAVLVALVLILKLLRLAHDRPPG